MGRVLVTGASGFVGVRLLEHLDATGVPSRAAIRKKALEPSGSAGHVIVGEINSQTDWGQALNDVNTVVHLAARAHVLKEEFADPLEAFREVNLQGTLKLARQCAELKVRRLVFLSSVGVNGNESLGPFTERNAPAPNEPYAVSKCEAEQALRVLAQETGLEVVIVRPPLVYGPNAPGNFGSLLRWVGKGLPLPLGAVTGNRRSFVALDNLVDFIVTCINHPAAANETFLVADGQDVSTAGLLREVGTAMGRPARLVPVPVPVLKAGAAMLNRREMARRLLGSLQVDASKAREWLEWTPPVSFEEGVRRAVAPLR